MIYDKYIVFFSGGKDSTACFLHLLEIGVPKEKIELWHHEIDGREGSDLMDWPITPGYCRAFASYFGVPIYFSWKQGGFEREMLRNSSRTAPTMFETPDGGISVVGGVGGKESSRLKFPQVSGNLNVRWCSAYLKIDVGASAIINQERFQGLLTVAISGERGEESSQRAKYADLEADRADLRDGISFARYVDRWRPIKSRSEDWVWAIIERWGVRVHPCYYMGWSRCSCQRCIFMDADQAASSHKCSPKPMEKVMQYEEGFGVTIKRKKSMRQLIAEGTPYASMTDDLIQLANAKEYDLPIIMENWFLPAGAYGTGCGPS